MKINIMHKCFLFYTLTLLITLTSCTGGTTGGKIDDGDTIQFNYARGLTMVKYDDFTEVKIADPWHSGKLLRTYLLVPSTEDVPDDLPKGTVVRTPLKSAVVFSTVHCNLLMGMKAQNVIKGVCDLQYVGIPYIQAGCKAGRIADCGSSMSPNVERIIDANPGALLISPYENGNGYGKLEETGIPVVECADYMESTALGRAEWMRFFGILTGREHEADSLFNVVEKNYLHLKAVAQRTKDRPTVLIDKKYGSVWYVPGGRSTIGMMVADAGGKYVFASEAKAGSVALSPESVLDRAALADIWLFRYASSHPVTYAELLSEYQGYNNIRAFIHHNAYGCNTMTSRFFEETPFRPDYLLQDFVSIFHPETGYKLRYFNRVSGGQSQ